MPLEQINIINSSENIPDWWDDLRSQDINPNQNVFYTIDLTLADSLGYHHYVRAGRSNADLRSNSDYWIIISTDTNGDVINYNINSNPNIPVYKIGPNSDTFIGYSKLKDATTGVFNNKKFNRAIC